MIYSETSAYQRIVVTSSRAGIRLFLNGNLQFHSRDEYRYHEALVHPAMAAHGAPRRVLVLGGGDGMAVREILQVPGVEQVTLVELDPHMTALFAKQPLLRGAERRLAAFAEGRGRQRRRLHAGSSQHDAMFDVIVIDFPDPTNFSIGKLYTTSFYELVEQPPRGRRLRGGADDLAADRAEELLDRGDDARGRRPDDDARTTRTCRASASGASSSPATGRSACRPSLPPGLRFLDAGRTAGAVRISRPTWRACRPR